MQKNEYKVGQQRKEGKKDICGRRKAEKQVSLTRGCNLKKTGVREWRQKSRF